jgi:hypothetical protein
MTITDNLRDAAYIVIGMGVISVQRAQVRREELRKQFEGATKQFEDAAKQAEAFLSPVVEEIRKATIGRLPN